MWQRRVKVLRALKGRSCHAKLLQARGLVDRINGTSSATRFSRFWDTQSASPDVVANTLCELVKERSGDVYLLQALSKRFHESAEEFFPVQIDNILGSFAQLGHADEPLLAGFVGRLDDVVADASPRRVVRLLRNGAILQLEPEAWLNFVLPQLHRHLPNMREGVPSVLGSLNALRFHHPELIDLLATQGLLVAKKNDDGFFTRLFENWSRHGSSHEEMEGRGKTLAGSSIDSLDIRDNLNLLAGLIRCGATEASALESQLEEKLRGAALDDAVVTLEWMRRLSLRSPALWRVCGDSVELALRTPHFVRDRLPDAIDALAALSGTGAEGEAEAALVASLLGAAETRKALPRYPAERALQLLRAAVLTASIAEGKTLEAIPLAEASTQVSRLGQQLTLWERRTARQAAELLDDIGKRHSLGLETQVAGLRSLSSVALPPLIGEHEVVEADWSLVEAGPELLLQREDAGSGHVVRFVGAGDAFATSSAEALRPTPSCRMSMRVAELHGWKVELRA